MKQLFFVILLTFAQQIAAQQDAYLKIKEQEESFTKLSVNEIKPTGWMAYPVEASNIPVIVLLRGNVQTIKDEVKRCVREGGAKHTSSAGCEVSKQLRFN
ncbi:hypothetical protein EZS27_028063 [termite gut metagenome]|uniref:Uncharacterized protein n=1 Tax=termite gut metagenome TaxID=433724 RepID=A0A5J4QN01_9ZZZZ